MIRGPLRVEPRQFGTPNPSAWENELADVLEETFAQGTHDLAGVVVALNRSRVRPPAGGTWTEGAFQAVMKQLGA